MNESGRDPFFIHSLHRSGSTYLFNALRRVTLDGKPRYTCFQEPIHELAFYARHNPDVLLTIKGSGSFQQLRHPQLEKPYFQELYDIHSAWKDVISPEIIYSGYFGAAAGGATLAYLRSIIEAAPSRPIIQECRTPLRIAFLKEQLGGSHVFLWRNPWDQWWSLKATDYFDTAHQLILNAPAPPRVISALRDYIGFESCEGLSINDQFLFYGLRRPSAESSYLTYFTLYMLSMLEAGRVADFSINIDQLSSSSDYREKILEKFEAHRIQGMDFSDCHVAQAPYDKRDASFFEPLERRVVQWLKEEGHETEKIAHVQRLREENAPLSGSRPKTSRFPAEIWRLRDVLIRTENREAAALRELNGKVAVQQAELTGLDQRNREIENVKGQLEASLAKERSAKGAQQALLAEAGISEEVKATISSNADQLRQLTDNLAAQAEMMRAGNAALTNTVASLGKQLKDIIKDRAVAARDCEIDRLRRQIADNEMASREQVALKEASIQERDAEIARLNETVAALDRQVQQLSFMTEAFKNSTSWKLAAPLRGMKYLYRAAFGWPKGNDLVDGHRAGRRSAKANAKLVMQHGLLWLRRRPRVAAVVLDVVRLAPPLERRLLSFARTSGGLKVTNTGWALEADPIALEAWRKRLKAGKSR